MTPTRSVWPLLLMLVLVQPAASGRDSPISFQLTSSALANGQEIPVQYTCEGDNGSPPLSRTEPPSGSRSLALIVDDPDASDPKAPRMTWVHWVVYGLPAGAGSLPDGVTPKALPGAGRFGRNDWRHAGYGGPSAPIGRYRYFHKLSALDVELSGLGESTKVELLEAMKGHVLAHTELFVTYPNQAR